MTELNKWVDSFSKTLKKLMNERGVTATTVAQATKIPKSSLSEWMSGRTPKLDHSVVKLAKFFGVTVEYLITGVVEHPEEEILKGIAKEFEGGFVTIHRGIYRINIEKQVSPSPNKTNRKES